MTARSIIAGAALALAGCGITDVQTVVEDPDGQLSAGAELSAPVRTTAGPLRGFGWAGTWAFLGIPYADEPQRFEPPRPKQPWVGTLRADRFGAKCVQLHGDRIEGAEDCLTLNVWTPKGASGPLPVLVFIHGGKNVEGSAREKGDGVFIYDGSPLALAGPAVVVTFNYRLGALGFLAHARGPKGNQGLEDQLLALQWVKDNARAFGGDPSRILAFGQSAGANDLCALMASRRSEGLFTRAMLLSASGDCYAVEKPDAEALGAAFVRSVGCAGAPDVSRCLRDAPLAKLLEPLQSDAVAGESFAAATIDGTLLERAPLEVFRSGRVPKIPIIVSTTADEFMNLGAPWVKDDAALEARVANKYPWLSSQQILAPYASDGSPWEKYVALVGDDWFTCPARTLSAVLSREPGATVRRALFAEAFDVDPRYATARAGHGMDLFFGFDVFGNVVTTQPERDFALELMGDWTRFADSGEPSPAWPRYEEGRDDAMVLESHGSHAIAGVRTEKCEMWNRYYGQ